MVSTRHSSTNRTARTRHSERERREREQKRREAIEAEKERDRESETHCQSDSVFFYAPAVTFQPESSQTHTDRKILSSHFWTQEEIGQWHTTIFLFVLTKQWQWGSTTAQIDHRKKNKPTWDESTEFYQQYSSNPHSTGAIVSTYLYIIWGIV